MPAAGVPMRQAVLFAVLHLIGTGVALALGPRQRTYLCCALGFPLGLAVMVPPLMLLAAVGVPYHPLTVLAVAALIIGAVVYQLRRRGWPDRQAARVIGAWTGGFTAVAVGVSAVSLAALTFDSHLIVFLGRVLAEDGGFDQQSMHVLGDRGGFLVIAHSWATFIGLDYLYALAPMLALSFAAAFSILAWTALTTLGVDRRSRLIAVALVTAVLFTTWMVQYHSVYVHENLSSAIYLCLFAALFWQDEVDKDITGLPLAFIALLAFALMRIENTVAAALFLALALLPGDLPRRPVVVWGGLFAALVALWNVLLGLELPDYGRALTLQRCLLMAVLPAVVLGYWVAPRPRPLRWLDRHAALVALVAMAVAVTAAFLRRPDDMPESGWAMWTNLTTSADWGHVWLGLAVLGVIGAIAVRVPAWRLPAAGPLLYLGLILLLSYGRHTYTVGTSDSANRMALQVLPLACYGVALALGILLGGGGGAASRRASSR